MMHVSESCWPAMSLIESWFRTGVVRPRGSRQAAALLRGLGARINNPSLAGVNLKAPIHFFFMDPKKYSSPWVYRFGVTDATALKKAIAESYEPAAPGRASDDRVFQPPVGTVEIKGEQATWWLDVQAADSVQRWLASHHDGVGFRRKGQLVLRAHVPEILRVFDAEIKSHVAKMKARMREALEKSPQGLQRERAVSSAQTDLETVLALLQQVSKAEMDIEVAHDHARVSLDVTAMPGSPLAEFIKAHPAGSLELLRCCPNDALVVVAHNLAIRDTLRNMFMQVLGWPQKKDVPGLPAASFALAATAAAAASADGHTAFALFSSGVAEAPAEIMELRSGQLVAGALERWRDHSVPTASDKSLPYYFRVLPQDNPGPESVQLADVLLDETVLGSSGVNLVHWLFGPRPRAALGVWDKRSAFLVGAAPAQRLERIRALSNFSRGKALLSDRQFTGSLAGLPGRKPNLIVYVSPVGLRKWLALAGGKILQEPDSEEYGLAASVTFLPEDTIRGVLQVPTEVLKHVQPPAGEGRGHVLETPHREQIRLK